MILKAPFFLLIGFSISLVQEYTFIDHLVKNNYTCIHMNSHKEMIDYLNSDVPINNQVTYWKSGDFIYGFFFLDEAGAPSLFVCDDNSLTFFASSCSYSKESIDHTYL